MTGAEMVAAVNTLRSRGVAFDAVALRIPDADLRAAADAGVIVPATALQAEHRSFHADGQRAVYAFRGAPVFVASPGETSRVIVPPSRYNDASGASGISVAIGGDM